MKKLLFIAFAVVLALSVGLVGCGGGGAGEVTLTISSTTGGHVTTPGEGTFEYVEGKVVSLVAAPFINCNFINWTGDFGTIADPNDPTTTITMSGNYSIVANFVEGDWNYTIPLTFHSTISQFASINTKVYTPWLNRLKAITGTDGGNFSITSQTYGTSPFSAEQSLTQIGAGIVDIGQLSGDTFDLGGLGNLPYLFPNMTSAVHVMYNLLSDTPSWDAFDQLEDVKILLVSPLQPAQYIGTKNVTALGNFSGMKLRAEAGDVPFVRFVGGTPITIGTDSVYTAMGSILDGVFFTYNLIVTNKLWEVADYTTECDLFPRLYFLAMNKDSYDSLHSEAKAALDALCTEAWSLNYSLEHYGLMTFDRNRVTGNYTSQGHGAVWQLPQVDRDVWKTSLQTVWNWYQGNMTNKGYNGTGIMARVNQLLLTAP